MLHSLNARFNATPTQFTLESVDLNTPRSRFTASGIVSDYSNPAINARYQASVDGAEFRQVLKNPSVPTGTVELSGVVDYKSEPNRSFMDTAKVNGEIHSARLNVPYQRTSVGIVNLGARYALSNGNADVVGLRASVLGGHVDGTLSIHALTGNTKSALSLHTRGISVADVQKLAAPNTAEHGMVRGAINADANAKWGKTLADLIARADISLKGTMQPTHGDTGSPGSPDWSWDG